MGSETHSCAALFPAVFFSESWVLRYFVLSGDTLVYYADEGAEKSSTPLGFKRVGGTRVLVEGPKKHGHYWAFFVDADAGERGLCATRERRSAAEGDLAKCHVIVFAETPVRLSTESKSDLDGWVRALERIGCKVEFMSDELRPPARQSRRGIAAAGEPEGKRPLAQHWVGDGPCLSDAHPAASSRPLQTSHMS